MIAIATHYYEENVKHEVFVVKLAAVELGAVELDVVEVAVVALNVVEQDAVGLGVVKRAGVELNVVELVVKVVTFGVVNNLQTLMSVLWSMFSKSTSKGLK